MYSNRSDGTMKLIIHGIVLLFYAAQVFSANQISCIKWSQSNPSIFQPTPNVNNQIAPDYGIYWLRHDPKTGGEDYKRAYTPSDYEPYFSNGTKNNNPDPKSDGGAARAKYNATQLKGFYDPNKPTMIFFHGWQPGMTAAHQRIDLCYSYPNGKNSMSPLYDTLKYWQGWNVAVFYWNQFADESSFEDAEAKLYSSTVRQHMRWAYLKPGDSKVQYCTASDSNCLMPTDAKGHVKPVTELAYEAVVNAVPSVNKNVEFRIAGQSFGAQLATFVTKKLMTNNAGTLLPTRLVLLDPYFTVGNLDKVFGGQRVVDYVNQEVQDIESHNIPVAEYRTSLLSHLPFGDWNPWLMAHTAYERLYPKYIKGASGASLLAAQHRSSIYLYFQSQRAAPFWNHDNSKDWDRSYINAQSTNAEINQMMTLQRDQGSTPKHTSEYDFLDTQDDVFNLK
jgi:hypothetical protein